MLESAFSVLGGDWLRALLAGSCALMSISVVQLSSLSLSRFFPRKEIESRSGAACSLVDELWFITLVVVLCVSACAGGLSIKRRVFEEGGSVGRSGRVGARVSAEWDKEDDPLILAEGSRGTIRRLSEAVESLGVRTGSG